MHRLPHHTQLNDDELLQQFRKSADNIWLGHLLQRHTLLLLGIAMKYLSDKDAAADAVQQIFLKTLSHLPDEPIANFKGWLYILMRNHCLQQLRDKTRFTGDIALAQLLADDGSDLEQLRQKEITLQEMQHALQTLVPEQRNCVDAFYLQKKSYTDIMAATGFSFAQVKSYIQNGKRNLKIILSRNLKNPQP